MSNNMIFFHGGGSTAVINSSLYGAITQAKKMKAEGADIGRIYASCAGTGGFLNEDLIDIEKLSDAELELLKSTPGSAIGTSRDHLEPEDYKKIVELFKKLGIKYVVLNGGNGTMDTCGKIYNECLEAGISVMGIPKTMDNDIAVTDHAPGYGSAARFMAQSVSEICADVKGMPAHIVIVEAMGRSAGWVAAAAALASDAGIGGPDLVYLPEAPFSKEGFLDEIRRLIAEKKSGVVVVSEGAKFDDGTYVAPAEVGKDGRTKYGDAAPALKKLIEDEIGYKVRNEKAGMFSRASIAYQSETDRDEAIAVGARAVEEVVKGTSGKMVGIKRISTNPYKVEYELIDIKDVMLFERKFPEEYINEAGNGVTKEFMDWCRPLLGSPLPKLISFKEKSE